MIKKKTNGITQAKQPLDPKTNPRSINKKSLIFLPFRSKKAANFGWLEGGGFLQKTKISPYPRHFWLHDFPAGTRWDMDPLTCGIRTPGISYSSTKVKDGSECPSHHQRGTKGFDEWDLPGTRNNHFKIDVGWFPTISYVKNWFIIQLKQPLINGFLRFQVQVALVSFR